MKYIQDFKKLNKIKEMASKGDEQAKDFLFGFMDMDDEQANKYLASIAIEENQHPQNAMNTTNKVNAQQEWIQVVSKLIEDENEAIDGYDNAIKFISNVQDNENVIALLNEIKNDEIEHIKKLKDLL